MAVTAPSIGCPTIYNIKLASKKRKRELLMSDVLADLTPFPMLIIPIGKNGFISHALCVVDNLIFDSLVPFALKLQKESLEWIFDTKVKFIHKAYHFNIKINPPG